MELEVPNIEEFVAVNRLSPVTDPIYLGVDGLPTPGGLFSAEIFGRPGSEDRRRRWAYIDLGGRFLHPLVYKSFCQLDRRFPELLAGLRRVTLAKGGAITDVPEDAPDGVGWSGVDALWDHWKDISWGTAVPGGQRAERIGLLRVVPRERAFLTKWPVMPALYRDIEMGTSGNGRIREIPPINSLYAQVMTGAPSRVSGFDFADGARKRRAQEVLLTIHESCLELVAGKHGVIQDRLLGKYADYAVQTVISSPPIAKAERPEEQEVPFGWLGVPLHLTVNLFQPFVLKSLDERLRALAGGQERILLTGADGKEKYLELPEEARAQLNADTYRRWVARFMRSQENRLDPLSVTTARGKVVEIPLYDRWLGRKTTLADLLLIAATVVTSDKHVMFTRYPIEDYRACHFARVAILTTEHTAPVTLGGTTYPRYLVVEKPVQWVDSVRLNNSYTSAMAADYDGDRIRLFGLFTQEANAEAAELIRKATNICDGRGAPSRLLKNEGVLTLYSMTK
jgi:hypothetical protein